MQHEFFDPHAVKAFRYVSWAFDATTGEAVLRYGLDGLELQETFVFPMPEGPVPAARLAAAERLMAQLFLAAGISYYKCAAPNRVIVESGTFLRGDIAYHRHLLAKGLGEFCWANNLDPDLSPVYEFAPGVVIDSCATITDLRLDAGPLIPVGGGKDSCVTVEALRVLGPTLISVNRYPVIQHVIDAAELPSLLVRRTLDPQLSVLNDTGALNGHVPVTAIVTFACLIAAVLHGHDAVVMSNERSASAGNVSYRGVEINHQWSKSDDAEAGIGGVLARITPDLACFSLLRRLSEIAVVARFAASATRYLGVFSSCNAAFRLDASRRVQRWCGQCPKCQFVWLALATKFRPAELVAIFGVDVFESSPSEGFAALLGLAPWKPFECVGDAVECRVALRLLDEDDNWRGHRVVRELVDLLRAADLWASDTEVEATLRASTPSPAVAALVPARYATVAASFAASTLGSSGTTP